MDARISSTVQREMRKLFENDSCISLREAASEIGFDHDTVWNISPREVIFFCTSYK